MTLSCLNCNRTDEQVPLISMTFKGAVVHLCPQCLPTLIHDPVALAEKLPGLDIKPGPTHTH